MLRVLLLITILAVLPVVVSAAIIHVPADQPTIQAGIDAAADGDRVLVADGIYSGSGNQDIDFKGKAITVTSENGAEYCIIKCDGIGDVSHRGIHFQSGETNETIVNGFMIINGFLTGEELGAGIYCEQSSPTISNCSIKYNATRDAQNGSGGGIACRKASPIIVNCTISNNFSDSGAGMAFRNSSPIIIDCEISYNQSGGGISSNYSSPIFVNCWIHKNVGYNLHQGAFSCVHSNLILSKCWITENSTPFKQGGAIDSYSSDLLIRDCLIAGNSSGSSNIALMEGDVTFENCTIASNTSIYYQYGGIVCHRSTDLHVKNCIIWFNEVSVYTEPEVTAQISYSNVEGGYPGVGNMDIKPIFVDGASFDFHLKSDSPCIDAGSSESRTGEDLDGNTRFQGGAVDMGAYEYAGWPSETRAYIKMPSHHFHPGDKASCIGSVWNPHEYVFDEYLFFAVLDIWGTFYCAPSYNMIDYYFQDCNPGLTEIQIMPEFTWPSGVGSATGIVWYAALVNPEMTELVSEIGVFDFGWSE